jgi:hypothetical protein
MWKSDEKRREEKRREEKRREEKRREEKGGEERRCASRLATREVIKPGHHFYINLGNYKGT